MPKLNNTQNLLLSSAAQRDTLSFYPLPGTLAKLAAHGGKGQVGLTVPVLVLPTFWWVSHHPTSNTLYGASTLLACVLDLSTGAILVAVAEALPRARRAGGFALIYAIAISAFGGSTQFAMAGLIRLTGDPLTPAYYMLVALVLGLIAM